MDVHLDNNGDKTAFIWEGDEVGDEKTITYKDLHRLVCKIANVLKAKRIGAGDSIGNKLNFNC